MNYFEILPLIVYVVLIFVTTFYLLSIILRKNDIADTAWGLGFITIASFIYFFISKTSLGLILLILIILWGLRLTIHIIVRNHGKPEDFRYKKWRDDWGKWFLIRSYFQVFLLQGLLMIVVTLPIVIGMLSLNSGFEKNLNVYIGLAIWLIGFLFETIGDYQLLKFIKNPENRGKILSSGLWRYTRHPNYFGEITVWWAILIIILPNPQWYIAIIGPLTITFLITKISGIPMLEKRYKNDKAYQEYARKTSVLLPWFPKK